ncbi:MAG: hypothetical protein KME60_11845 [Cyanomargarita calcarea GSE-NOS-MK-12-04C]|uniref:Uncharacterized protein n=1 Tax=Cyanomargarita calcarea GSE-NOS-MK-12-04C TaxID=2839659 RepID=A0A951UUN9_9CYAN|nr:hypothetical protein [Cyanomargarita calcarea GSE-NOS-MK-12-04C]
MSLNVSVHLIDQAKVGKVNEVEFVESIRESLPYAWNIVEGLAERLARGEEWANHAVAPPSEKHRAQLLRMIGGDAIRGAVERHFGVKLAFQNCHNVALFRPENLNSPVYLDFISVESQILSQTPELVDC